MEIEDPYGFIYITTNMINGKRYIGQKIFNKGWKNYIGSGITLKKAINKYGKENFKRDIVDFAKSQKELDNLEIQWISNYNAVNSSDFYNMAAGGHSGNILSGKSDYEIKLIKEKFSVINKGKNNPMYNKHHTNETKKKISQKSKGRKISPEQIRKSNETQGTPVVQLSIEGEFIAEYYGIYEAARQTKANPSGISKCCKGIKRFKTSGGFRWMFKSDYNKNNIEEFTLNQTKKAVIQLSLSGDFICEYTSLAEAQKQTNINQTKIGRCCKGKQNTSGGYKWIYKSDYIRKLNFAS